MSEGEMVEIVKELAKFDDFKMLKEPLVLSPDMVIEWDGKRIGMEFKQGLYSSDIAAGIGQLLLGKVVFALHEMWLVFPKAQVPKRLSLSWYETMTTVGIKPYWLDVTGFTRIDYKDCAKLTKMDDIRYQWPMRYINIPSYQKEKAKEAELVSAPLQSAMRTYLDFIENTSSNESMAFPARYVDLTNEWTKL
ncbi:MAG: hypothetical protein HYT70_01320 [Candidatus Aenigmarchaeota archaeon]|nr:hypothetical protein [Candidatus Aenigmarchaeota archaeon]